MKQTTSARFPVQVWPWVAASLCLVLFGLTTTRLPVPEESASYLVDHLRLTPFAPMDRPIWGWIIRGLAALSPTSVVAWANGLSVVLGALCVGLLGRLVARSVTTLHFQRLAPGLAGMAGWTAALALATSIPFWLVSNRAHPATLGLFLFLGALNLIQDFRLRGGMVWLWLGTLVYAVGLAELPTMMVYAPVVAGHILVMLWQKRRLSVRLVLSLLPVLLVAPLVWLISAMEYAGLPAAAWREMNGLGEAYRYGLVQYRDIILHSVPKQGWLIILFTSLLPWTISFFTARQDEAPMISWSTAILQGLITVSVVAILWNAPLTPWSMLGTQPLLVTPYVLIASAFAYGLVYWGSLLVPRVEVSRARWVPGLLAAVATVVCGGAAVLHRPEVSTAAAIPVSKLAAAMLDHVQGRDFVVSSGLLSSPLRLEARRQNRSITLVDLPLSDLSGYRRYLASLFRGERQKSLALAGLAPVLVEWLDTGTDAVERLALQVTPDIWLSEGYEPLPLGSAYLGTRSLTTADVERVRSVAQAFWPEAQIWLAEWQRLLPRQKTQARALAAYFARVANDTGVFFEHAGYREEARKAYAQARMLDADNVSAAANLVVLGQAAGWTGIDVEEADLALAVAPRDRSFHAVAARFGHLRRREAAQLVGTAGLSSDAPAEADAAWNAAVAGYLKGERLETRRRVEKLIAERPEFDPAWILLATLAYEQGDEATLQKCVRQMRTVRREWPELTVLLGRQALDRQDLTAAREFFERAAQLRPGDMPILELLLQLDLRERDIRRGEARVRQILAQQPGNVAGQLGLAIILRTQGRDDLAADTLKRVLEIQRHPVALSELAVLKLKSGQVPEAQALAEEAVAQGGRLASSHEALGLVHQQQGKLDQALDDYSRALALDAHRLSARVHLALALYRSGQVENGLELARTLRKERHTFDRELQEALDQLPE